MILSSDLNISTIYPNDLVIDSVNNNSKSNETIIHMYPKTTSPNVDNFTEKVICPQKHIIKIQNLYNKGLICLLLLKCWKFIGEL